jgi:UTP--glucose-1-phosphate uridylyltransferase
MTDSKSLLAMFDDESREFLNKFRFDSSTFAKLRAELEKGEFTKARNFLHAKIEPNQPEDIMPWPEAGSEAEKKGQEAIDAGQVGVVILNGGMATRFGGVVKGVVEALPGQSFLNLKLKDVGRFGDKVSIFLMNSFATEKDTKAHLKDHPLNIHMAIQSISVRLTPEGEPFRKQNGELALYAPGHGDVFSSLAASEDFQRFKANGGRYIFVSNVDNLAATLCPRVIGAHILGGKEVTAEVAPRYLGDKGGAPVRVDGRVAIVEGFRFPKDFDNDALPVFSTNNMVMNVGVFTDNPPLTWFRADKEVEGKPVVQFERLMGEITSFVESAYLHTLRGGDEGRFLPVKMPDDLKDLQEELSRRFQ